MTAYVDDYYRSVLANFASQKVAAMKIYYDTDQELSEAATVYREDDSSFTATAVISDQIPAGSLIQKYEAVDDGGNPIIVRVLENPITLGDQPIQLSIKMVF